MGEGSKQVKRAILLEAITDTSKRYDPRMPKTAPKRASSASSSANRLRIVGGRWRAMRVDFPPVDTIRPTPDRVRETLFNWLQSQIVDARCLDLFAGSGALGLEALSRGAAHVTFVEREIVVARHLKSTLERFQASNAEVIAMDALRFLRQPAQIYDVVFLDPPFASDVLLPACNALANGWVKAGSYVYLESSARAPLPALPAGWLLYRSKRAGEVGYHLARLGGEAAENCS
jgi:16S rRNA (guanine966-N2)-methyltransferase